MSLRVESMWGGEDDPLSSTTIAMAVAALSVSTALVSRYCLSRFSALRNSRTRFLVLVFYKGDYSAACRMYLRQWASEAKHIRAKGGAIRFISSQPQAKCRLMAKRTDLARTDCGPIFVSDHDKVLARKFGVPVEPIKFGPMPAVMQS